MNSQKNKEPNILVVVHDAGAAEIIVGYIKNRLTKDMYDAYAAGPAARIFRREKISFKSIKENKEKIRNIVGRHQNSHFILLGTGWMTKIEAYALEEAKRIGLKSVVYLESWVGYRERFEFPNTDWKQKLPTEIWLGDKFAYAIAKKQFPSKVKVRLVPNEYFKNIIKRFEAEKQKVIKPEEILFLSLVGDSASEEIFPGLLEGLATSKKHHILRIRFHPADDRSRYDKLIEEYKNKIKIKKSKEKDIVRDLLSARRVIGTETVAMIAPILVGIKTISIITRKRKSELPFKKIVRVRNVAEAIDLI